MKNILCKIDFSSIDLSSVTFPRFWRLANISSSSTCSSYNTKYKQKRNKLMNTYIKLFNVLSLNMHMIKKSRFFHIQKITHFLEIFITNNYFNINLLLFEVIIQKRLTFFFKIYMKHQNDATILDLDPLSPS